MVQRHRLESQGELGLAAGGASPGEFEAQGRPVLGAGVIRGEDAASISVSQLTNCRAKIAIEDGGVEGPETLFICFLLDEVTPEG